MAESTAADNLLRPLTALDDGPVLRVDGATATAGSHTRFRLIVFVDTLDGPGAEERLESAHRMLAEDGLILIAAYNRIRYPGVNGLRGLAEWQDLLGTCDLEKVAVLYPFPDHRQPALLLTDAAFRERRLNIGSLLEGCGAPDNVQWQALGENGLAAHFAKSFAILAKPRHSTAGAGLDECCLAYHYSTLRRPAFRTETRIRNEGGRLMVRRRRLHPEVPGHGSYAHCVSDEPYVEGELYGDRLRDLLLVKGWSVETVANWARPWLDLLRAHGRPGADAIPNLPRRFVDCIPFNLVRTPAGELRPIDAEYLCLEDLPLDFVAFRGLWLALSRVRTSAPDAGLRQWPLSELTFAVLEASGMAASAGRQQELIDREAELQDAIAGADRFETIRSLRGILLATEPQAAFIQSQLFWRRPETSFNEQDSARIATLASPMARTLPLRIPPQSTAPAALRLDIADRPGLARLFSLRLLDDSGVVLWKWDGALESLTASEHFESRFLVDDSSTRPAILYVSSHDPRLILPIAAGELARLQNGGTLEVEFAWAGSL